MSNRSVAKRSNVHTLQTVDESRKWDGRLAHAFMDLEPDLNELTRMTDLAVHIHWHELEQNKPISEAGSPLQTILERVQELTQTMRNRFYKVV